MIQRGIFFILIIIFSASSVQAAPDGVSPKKLEKHPWLLYSYIMYDRVKYRPTVKERKDRLLFNEDKTFLLVNEGKQIKGTYEVIKSEKEVHLTALSGDVIILKVEKLNNKKIIFTSSLSDYEVTMTMFSKDYFLKRLEKDKVKQKKKREKYKKKKAKKAAKAAKEKEKQK